MSRFMRFKNTNAETSRNTSIGDDEHTELRDYIEGVDYGFKNAEGLRPLKYMDLRKINLHVVSLYSKKHKFCRKIFKWGGIMTSNEIISLTDKLLGSVPETMRHIRLINVALEKDTYDMST
jgi:methylphosphotriester-DNA--protein-cysteine methyltransferase